MSPLSNSIFIIITASQLSQASNNSLSIDLNPHIIVDDAVDVILKEGTADEVTKEDCETYEKRFDEDPKNELVCLYFCVVLGVQRPCFCGGWR